MKYAWIQDQVIRDICPDPDPYSCYTSEVAAYYDTLVPDEAQNGDGWVDGKLIPKPSPPPPPPPPPPVAVWNDATVRRGLTLVDKTRWDNNDTQEIVTAKIEFETYQKIAYTTELLDYLVVSNSISQTSKDRVLANPDYQ